MFTLQQNCSCYCLALLAIGMDVSLSDSALGHPGRLVSPVISLAPRSYVKYDQAHWIKTIMRFRKPIKKKMCTKSQASQAKYPEICSFLNSATAAARPMVARLPLSK